MEQPSEKYVLTIRQRQSIIWTISLAAISPINAFSGLASFRQGHPLLGVSGCGIAVAAVVTAYHIAASAIADRSTNQPHIILDRRQKKASGSSLEI